MTFRPVVETTKAQPAMEGAGVHLHRVFGFGDTTQTDPFLMMDDFRNDVPAHYERGFPCLWAGCTTMSAHAARRRHTKLGPRFLSGAGKVGG